MSFFDDVGGFVSNLGDDAGGALSDIGQGAVDVVGAVTDVAQSQVFQLAGNVAGGVFFGDPTLGTEIGQGARLVGGGLSALGLRSGGGGGRSPRSAPVGGARAGGPMTVAQQVGLQRSIAARRGAGTAAVRGRARQLGFPSPGRAPTRFYGSPNIVGPAVYGAVTGGRRGRWAPQVQAPTVRQAAAVPLSMSPPVALPPTPAPIPLALIPAPQVVQRATGLGLAQPGEGGGPSAPPKYIP